MERTCPTCLAQTHEASCPIDGSDTISLVAQSSREPDPFLGQHFEGRYKIEARLGSGGMGSVYLATQLAVDRRLAVKILHAGFARKKKELLRFKQEARAIAALNHPNSIRLFDFGQTKEDVPYLVMEFLTGLDLAALLDREGPLETGRVVRLALQAFGALSEAHAKGIVHRDLKPANLFMTHIMGEGETLKVLDFGIAKIQGDLGSDTTLTQQGTTIGSPRYMAPEQARALEIKPATDLYAMGCILYELLTGRPVFIRHTASDYIIAHVKEDPPWPCIGQRRLEGPLIEFILRCLEKRVDDRPKDASEALEILKSLAAAPLSDISVSKVARSPRERRKSETGLFPRATQAGQRSKRISGPLSTSQIGLVEDPTAKIPVRPNRVWWSMTALSLVAALVGLGVLFFGTPSLNEDSSVEHDGPGHIHPQTVAVGTNELEAKRSESSRAVATTSDDGEAAEFVTITMDSEPRGARVWRGNKVLGVTPFGMRFPTKMERVHLRLTLSGYRVGQASFLPSHSFSMKVPLTHLDEKVVPLEAQ